MVTISILLSLTFVFFMDSTPNLLREAQTLRCRWWAIVWMVIFAVVFGAGTLVAVIGMIVESTFTAHIGLPIMWIGFGGMIVMALVYWCNCYLGEGEHLRGREHLDV